MLDIGSGLLSSVVYVFNNGTILKSKGAVEKKCNKSLNELQAYIRSPVVEAVPEFDVISYWYMQKSGPLRSMSLDILSTPASSSSVERLYSKSKIDDKPLRQRLNLVKKGEMQIMKSLWNFQAEEIIDKTKDYFSVDLQN